MLVCTMFSQRLLMSEKRLTRIASNRTRKFVEIFQMPNQVFCERKSVRAMSTNKVLIWEVNMFWMLMQNELLSFSEVMTAEIAFEHDS